MAPGTEQQGAWGIEAFRGAAGLVVALVLTLTLGWMGLGAVLESATAHPTSTQVVSGTFTASAPQSYAQPDPGRIAPLRAIGG